MRRIILCASGVLALMLASSCQNDQPISEIENEVIITNQFTPEENLQLGILNIKITPEFAEQVERETRDDGTVDVKAVKSLGKAIKDLGIVSMERLFPYAGKFEARTRAEGMHLWYTIKFDENKSITRAAGSLEMIPGIQIIDPLPEIVLEGSNEVAEYVTATASASPTASSNMVFNDPMLEKQWHYYNNGSASSAQSGCDINVFPVWKSYTTGSPDVVVAVVDGGIDYQHEDLADNMWHDPEDNRRVGFNFCTDNYAITPHDHGTHVAGTVAAVNNNGIGVCGIAGGNAAAGEKGIKLMSCQIFQNNGGGGSGEKAIKWAADHGAHIAQNSWGLTSPSETPAALRDAVDYFTKYAGVDEKGKQVGPMIGGLVIFAAGNDNSSQPYGSNYEKMLTVTSVGADYVRAYYSNYGDWCDIAAPGGDVQKGNQVVSTLPGNNYGKMQGTSMACPHVSGVAALVLSKKGGQGFTNTALRDLLEKNTTDISAYNRQYYMGSGLVNAYLAIAGQGGVAPDRVTEFTIETPYSNSVTFNAIVPADQDDTKPNTMIVYYSDKPITSTNGLMFSSFYVGDTKVGQKLSGQITGLEFSKKYYFAIVACDLAGNKSLLSEVKSVKTGINHAPVIDLNGAASVITLKSFENVTINMAVNDPDGHFYKIEHKAVSAAETLDTLIMATPRLKIDAVKADPGTYSTSISATDSYGLSTTQKFQYTILKNFAPEVIKQIPDQMLNSKSAQIQLNEKEFFTDQDGESLSYKISNSNEAVINVNYSKGVFYLSAMGFGYADITVTATDAKGENVSQSFKVLVRDSSEPVDIYPNPMVDFLYVRTSEEASCTVKLTNLMGSAVFSDTLSISPFNPAKIDVSKLPAGTYTLILSYNDTQMTRTVVKL